MTDELLSLAAMTENSGTPELTDEEMQQGVLDQMILKYNLDEGLPPEDRDAGLALATRFTRDSQLSVDAAELPQGRARRFSEYVGFAGV